jgi:hypothetical protein
MEMALAIAAIGTAIGLFPALRPYGERIALTHLFFRFFEAIAITLGIIAMLTLLTLSREFAAAAAPDVSAYHVAGTLLHAVYNWAFMFGPLLFLGINTMMYSSLLYKSQLVPRSLAAVGVAGAALVFGYGMLVMFGVTVQGADLWVLLAMPIAVYEMALAGWLIVKGFNPSAITAEPVNPAPNALLSAV